MQRDRETLRTKRDGIAGWFAQITVGVVGWHVRSNAINRKLRDRWSVSSRPKAD